MNSPSYATEKTYQGPSVPWTLCRRSVFGPIPSLTPSLSSAAWLAVLLTWASASTVTFSPMATNPTSASSTLSSICMLNLTSCRMLEICLTVCPTETSSLGPPSFLPTLLPSSTARPSACSSSCSGMASLQICSPTPLYSEHAMACFISASYTLA
uniref:Pentatricopeptide repeat-containing protein At2g03880 n=1 Tax=Rhizophora mucronata TaxID=61149 RepID=A0A2P2Q4Y2_RHIMU